MPFDNQRKQEIDRKDGNLVQALLTAIGAGISGGPQKHLVLQSGFGFAAAHSKGPVFIMNDFNQHNSLGGDQSAISALISLGNSSTVCLERRG